MLTDCSCRVYRLASRKAIYSLHGKLDLQLHHYLLLIEDYIFLIVVLCDVYRTRKDCFHTLSLSKSG